MICETRVADPSATLRINRGWVDLCADIKKNILTQRNMFDIVMKTKYGAYLPFSVDYLFHLDSFWYWLILNYVIKVECVFLGYLLSVFLCLENQSQVVTFHWKMWQYHSDSAALLYRVFQKRMKSAYKILHRMWHCSSKDGRINHTDTDRIQQNNLKLQHFNICFLKK